MSFLLTSMTLMSALPTLLAFHCSPFVFNSAPVDSTQKPFDVTLTFQAPINAKKMYQLCKLDKNGKASLYSSFETSISFSRDYSNAKPIKVNYTTVVGERWLITDASGAQPCTGNLYGGVMYFSKPTKAISSEEWFQQCDISCHSNTALTLPTGKQILVSVTNTLNEPVDYCQVFGNNQFALIEQLKGYGSSKNHETKTQSVYVIRKMSAKGPCKGENIAKPFSYQASTARLTNELIGACP
jgi:hypothetical protein